MFSSLLWLLSTFLSGLNAGLLAAAWLEEHYLRPLDFSEFLPMHQARDRLLRRLMPPPLTLLLVCTLLLFVLQFGAAWGWWLLLAFACILVDVLLTVRRMVPLNQQLEGWDISRPTMQGQMVRQKWYGLHRLRTGLGLMAFTALLIYGLPAA